MTTMQKIVNLGSSRGLHHDEASNSIFEFFDSYSQLCYTDTHEMLEYITVAMSRTRDLYAFDIMSSFKARCERYLKQRQLGLIEKPIQDKQLDLGMSKAEKVAVVFGGEVTNG